MSDILDDTDDVISGRKAAPPPAPYRVAPAYMALESLKERHSDAVTSKRQAEDLIFELEHKLRRARENLDYHTRREVGMRRRIIAGRDAIRADEDDSSGIF